MQVRKKDGRLQKFDRRKLLGSLVHSMHMTGFRKTELAPKITDDAIRGLKKSVASSVDISNAVCSSLKKNRHHDLCDAYSLVWLHAKPSKIRYVIKKHGGREKFSPEKLFKSVQKAFKNSYSEELRMLQTVVNEILALLNKKHAGKSVSHEEIHDIVEYVLIKKKLAKIAQHYIMYKYR